MNNFFNMNGGIFSILSKFCDVLFLSLIWIVFCIPIITIGPANTALYYATVKVLRRERGYLFREFFRSFRLNFKRAAILGVVLTIVFVVLILDIFAARTALNNGTKLSSALFGIYITLTVFVLGISLYIFPLLSRFDMSIKQLIRASAFISIRHLLSTIIMIIITLASIVSVYLIPLLIFVTPALSTLSNSVIMERIIKRYMPERESSEENKKDEWYME